MFQSVRAYTKIAAISPISIACDAGRGVWISPILLNIVPSAEES
jgi:hypothetical protein